MSHIKATPFIKWAGGKRQLIPYILSKMPKKFNNYFEPFVGGGAIFFELSPKHSIINDINKSLINAYIQIRDNHEDFLKIIHAFDEKIVNGKKEYFYQLRELYNDKIMKQEYDMELACLFVFLNKHCFNGLYRVNSKGLFNVPYNNSLRNSCEIDNIKAVSISLKNVDIITGDFEKVCNQANKGDFVFIDSPYAPLNDNSFESYTKEGFDKESHERLAKSFKKMSDKGCYCMLTNHDTDFINNLYSDFKKDVINVKRLINSDANKRFGTEVIITNY